MIRTLVVIDVVQDVFPDWELYEPFYMHLQDASPFFLTMDYNDEQHLLTDVEERMLREPDADWRLVIVHFLQDAYTVNNRFKSLVEKMNERFVDPVGRLVNRSLPVWMIAVEHPFADRVPDEEKLTAEKLDLAGTLTGMVPAETEAVWNTRLKELLFALPVSSPKRARENSVSMYGLDWCKEELDTLFEEWHSLNQIEGSKQEFLSRIQNRVREYETAGDHVEYLPAVEAGELIYGVLKDMNSVSGTLNRHSRLIQLPIDTGGMPADRHSQWFGLLACLDILLHDESQLTRISPRTWSVLTWNWHEEDTQAFLWRYRNFLNQLEEKLDNQLLDRYEMNVTVYDLDDKRISDVEMQENLYDIEKTAFPEPGQLEPETLENASDLIVNRIKKADDTFLSLLDKGYQRLKISQKELPVQVIGEDRKINDYLEELNDKEERQRLRMENVIPERGTEVEDWIEAKNETFFYLDRYLKARPSLTVQVLTMVLVWFVFCLPGLYVMLQRDSGVYLSFLAYSILMAVVVVWMRWLAMRRIHQPVENLHSDLQEKQKELRNRQEKRHLDAIRYVDEMYQLNRIQKIKAAVEEKRQAHQLENMQIRYHLRKVKAMKDSVRFILAPLEKTYGDLLSKEYLKESDLLKTEIMDDRFDHTHSLRENSLVQPFAASYQMESESRTILVYVKNKSQSVDIQRRHPIQSIDLKTKEGEA